MAKLLFRFWWVILIPIALFGINTFRSRPRTVEVFHPVQKTVVESIAVAGRARGQVETNVGAQISGRVADVPVREGDRVMRGQVLARLDNTTLRTQVRQAANAVATAQMQVEQAQDAIATANASLTVASRPPLASDVTRLKADIAQNIAVAEAKLAAAQQRFAELKEGATREVRQQIEAQVEQAKANLAQAERDLSRQENLVKEGATAQSTVDSAQTARDVARRTLENLLARQAEIRVGSRREQLAQAQADVRAAQATVAGIKASGDAQLKSLLASPRPEDVQLARVRVVEAGRAKEVAAARLQEAQIALSVAQSRLQDAVVIAPFDGTIAQIVTEAGGVTGPNQPIVRLVRWSIPEIRADLDEINLGKISVGQEATITSEAFPGESFTARIREIGAQVDADRGTVEVRLTPVQQPSWLRPGQTVSVNIIVDKGSPRLVIPLTAVTTIGGTSTVLIVENGLVARKEIKVGPPSPEGIPVRSGLTAQDSVITSSAGIVVGQPVVPQTAAEKKG